MLRLSSSQLHSLQENIRKGTAKKSSPLSSKPTQHANRGKNFELLIELANNQYKAKRLAIIEKIETPWQVIREGKNIVSAFPKKESSVDYFGIYNGKAFVFEAKSTEDLESFPLCNIKDHQMNFLEEWINQKGNAFLLIEFSRRQEVYFFSYHDIERFWKDWKGGGKAEIPYTYFLSVPKIGPNRGIVLDYLACIC